MQKYTLLSIILFIAVSAFAQDPDHWETYTQNRATYRVVSPLNGDMATHFVGLQADKNLLSNNRRGFVLARAGFRKDEKTGEIRCFEAVFQKPPTSLEPSKIPIELIAFDIRYPERRAATYQAVWANLQIDQEKTEVRCQIPVDKALNGNLAFVLVAKPPFILLSVSEYAQFGRQVLFDGPWDENGKEPVFIYAPVPGVEDYEGFPMEQVEGPVIKMPNASRPLPSGYEYNDYGYPIPSNLAYWRRKGSNYARSYYEDGKYGMRAGDGTILFPAQYDQIHFEYCGFMIAVKDGKSGVVNEANEVVIPFENKRLELLYTNHVTKIPKGVSLDDLRLIAYREGDKVGILNGRGQVISPFRPSRLVQVQHFYDADRNARGYILSEPLDYASVVRESALIYRFDKAGAINGNGEVILPFEYQDIKPLYGAKTPGWVQVEKDGQYGLFDLHGKWIFPPQYVGEIGLLHNISGEEKPAFPSLFIASVVVDTHAYGVLSTKAGLIDSLGQTVLPFEYEGFGISFKWEGKRHFFARKNKKWGLVDEDNQVVIPFQHGKIFRKYILDDQPYFSLKDSTGQYYGLLSMSSEMVVPFKYKGLDETNGQLLEFTNENGMSGLVNAQGQEVLAPEYSAFALLRSGYFQCVRDKLTGIVNPSGELIVEPVYRSAYPDNLISSFSGSFKAIGIDEADVIAVLTKEEAVYAFLKNEKFIELQ